LSNNNFSTQITERVSKLPKICEFDENEVLTSRSRCDGGEGGH
jgi:hypothetical protein